jgi:hypothetical protein
MVIWIFEKGPGMFTYLWNGKNASLKENNWKLVFYPESFLRGAVLRLCVHDPLTPGIDDSLGAIHDMQFAQDIVDMALSTVSPISYFYAYLGSGSNT